MKFTAVTKLPKLHAALSLLALTLLVAVPAAFAHTHPTEMMPAANAEVSAPEKIMIHFSEALEPKFSTITVSDAGGHVINKEPSVVSTDNMMMSVPLPSLKPGIYTVNWVGVAVDTHRSQGDYKFTVK